MKRLLMTALALALMMTAALAEPERTILLFTDYEQLGWGDALQVGWVDSAGELWLWDGHANETDWPVGADAKLEWMRSRTDAVRLGRLSDEALLNMKGLIESLPDESPTWQAAACDAGTEESYALRDGAAILLGGSGDDWCENSDPSAQALYLMLRECFPGVKSYWGEKGMSPLGFERVSLPEFCGFGDVDLDGGRWTRAELDCEAGLGEETELETAPEWVAQGWVTGKASSMGTTGGTTVYTCYDADGHALARFEFYGELLVRSDGMYRVQCAPRGLKTDKLQMRPAR